MVFGLITGLNLPHLIKDKIKKDICLYLALYLFTMAFGLAIISGVNLPNPVHIAAKFTQTILGLSY